MNRIPYRFIALIVSVFFMASPGLSIQPIPKESGIGGFINAGAGWISVESNMIAGNGMGDIGKERTGSLIDSPDSESDVIPIINGELSYTFASTRTQLFFGNTLEDFIRFEAVSQAGARQELPDQSILAVSYVFSGIPTEVWADPYVVDQDRGKTDRNSSGLRLGYDKILGSDFEIQFTWRDIDLEDERSGLTQLGLPANEVALLNREGESYQFEVLYPFRFENRKHILVPAFTYARLDLDGGAMANDRYQGQLTYLYNGEIFSAATNLIYSFASYDETNPIYTEKREDNTYGGSLTVFYKNFLQVEKMSLVGTAAVFESDANIDFYDTRVTLFGMSVLYRF